MVCMPQTVAGSAPKCQKFCGRRGFEERQATNDRARPKRTSRSGSAGADLLTHRATSSKKAGTSLSRLRNPLSGGGGLDRHRVARHCHTNLNRPAKDAGSGLSDSATVSACAGGTSSDLKSRPSIERPVGGLIGVGRPQNQIVAINRADDLQTDGQALLREPAWHGDGGLSR